jgi:hypothetical protein
LLLVTAGALKSFAGMNIPVDPATGEVVYKKTFKLSDSYSADDAYLMVQDWFNEGVGKFTSQNTESGKSEKGMALFDNSHPLQSLDNESRRMTGKGVVKFYGGFNSSINLVYVEYYILLEVHSNQLTATISQMQYHHVNRHNGNALLIYNWQGGKPFDSADKFHKLLNTSSYNKDIDELGSFLNKDIAKLLNNLGTFLKGKNALEKGSVS